jgi:eukaryotic-like serine/threonine-protein kinase
MTPVAGARFGPYEILEKIGSGGMGEVYRALDTRLDREVALKLVSESYLTHETPQTPAPSGVSPSSASHARFLREARAASALNHPNVCTIYDIGDQEGKPYLVMELLQGKTLKQYLAGLGRLSPAEVLSFAQQATSAFIAAHSRGVIHRDIKPANIFVVIGSEGQAQIKILDFGLAKRQMDPLAAETSGTGVSDGDLTATGGARNELTLTSPGSTIGTIAYMSPEQAKGEPLDARSDLFSLGSVLYEAASGASPFAGASPAEVFAALLLKDPAPARSLNPDLPPGLDPILAKLLAKDKAKRYQSAPELRADLDSLMDTGSGRVPVAQSSTPLPAPPPPPAKKRSRAAVFAVSGLGALVVVASLAYYFSRQHPSAAPSADVPKTAVTMSEKDSIILADFVNNTGNPVFDTTLNQALAIQLQQSPMLNIVNQQHLRQSMKYLGKSSDDPLSPAIAREIGEREGVKAILTGTIASLGKDYVITLNAQATATGDDIASEQAQSPDVEHVLDALDKAATAMRARLGESLSSIQKLDTPLGQATTPSLEAFRVYALGDVEHEKGLDIPQASGHYLQAVELDPNFAMAWARLGVVFSNAGQTGKALEYYTRAYNLSKNISERERLYITGHYFMNVTGDISKVIDTLELSIRTYPHEFDSLVNISVAYQSVGRVEDALAYSRKAVAMQPDDAIAQENLIQDLLQLDRFQEAQEDVQKANQLGIGNGTGLLISVFQLDALTGDTAGKERAAGQVEGRPDEFLVTAARAGLQEYQGKYRDAQLTWQSAAAQAAAQKAPDAEASWLLFNASGKGFAGECQDSEKSVKRALSIDKTKPTLRQAAFTASVCNNKKVAESLLKDLEKKYPSDTIINGITIPESRAMLALAQHHPAEALGRLDRAKSYDLASPAAYLRGLAYLDLHDGPNAVIAFQRALQYKGTALTLGYQNYPQAQLGLARAYTIEGDKADAKTAYQALFNLWKIADPDLPQLLAAQKEFAAL